MPIQPAPGVGGGGFTAPGNVPGVGTGVTAGFTPGPVDVSTLTPVGQGTTDYFDPTTGLFYDKAGNPISIQQVQTDITAGAAGKLGTGAAYAQLLLQQWGIPLDKKLQNWITQTAGTLTQTQIQQYLIGTPEFHQQFPGIFNPDGTLKMTPSSYLSAVKQFQATATQEGVNLGDKRLAFLFRNDVSTQEFATRASALTTLRVNQQYFDAFNEQLKQQGEQPLTRQDMFKFVLGEGNQKWYDLWNQSTTRFTAEQAGISFGRAAQSYTALPQSAVSAIAGKQLSPAAQASAFGKLAQDLTSTLPLSKIQKFNISKSDLVELEFGGPHQASIAQRVQQILQNEKAFQANQVTSRTALGLGQTRSTTRGEEDVTA